MIEPAVAEWEADRKPVAVRQMVSAASRIPRKRCANREIKGNRRASLLSISTKCRSSLTIKLII